MRDAAIHLVAGGEGANLFPFQGLRAVTERFQTRHDGLIGDRSARFPLSLCRAYPSVEMERACPGCSASGYQETKACSCLIGFSDRIKVTTIRVSGSGSGST